MIITTILIFILVLGILVFVHEAGHFIMAKRAGMKVEEFGFGFPPKIFGFRRGETDYTINLIPLGGFVKILGENGEKKDDPGSFASKSVWARFKVLVAGVSANVLLAAVFFSIAIFFVAPTASQQNFHRIYNRDNGVAISAIAKDSPAEKAGLKIDDIILSISNGSAKAQIIDSGDVEKFVTENKGKELIFEIFRDEKTLSITALARQDVPAGQGATGISLSETRMIPYNWYESILEGIRFTGYVIYLTGAMLFGIIKGIIFTRHVNGEFSGPIGIMVMGKQAADMGLLYLMQFIAFLSVNLAIINALPFPALDGGRILFLALEKLKGRPVSQEFENTVHTVGMVFILLLMVLVTFKDIGTYDVWNKVKGLL